jgi:hypothetical protein
MTEKTNIAFSAFAGALLWQVLCYFISLDFIAFSCSLWGIAGGAAAAFILESRERTSLRDGIIVGALCGALAAVFQIGYGAIYFFGGGIEPFVMMVLSSMFVAYLLLHVLFGMFGGIAAIVVMKKPY